MDPTYLFVYGTLRPGFNNPFAQLLRASAQYIGDGTLPGRLFDLGQYPGVVHDPSGPALVRGSVYDFGKNKTILDQLDHYEGVSNPPDPADEYRRGVVTVVCNGTLLDCWVYLYNWPVDKARLVASGTYNMNE
ncbi:gamma-glutamylcyclotransferase (GGCT)/AIG2-like uncharacterized protein YtfP [Spirosoma lacussanchae]|uniref:gamma-glutamylcyclotransferase family protein n=1 Tax=Spirosoma lacussanchae TaxID=1884249 RepID=UPI001109BD4B|nr:gamma-glutamylcyclotransferase family protein [Spirosoma lacussanchae]